jgi:hypothetical protein
LFSSRETQPTISPSLLEYKRHSFDQFTPSFFLPVEASYYTPYPANPPNITTIIVMFKKKPNVQHLAFSSSRYGAVSRTLLTAL